MADILIRGISLPEGELKYVSLWVYGDGRVYVRNNGSAAFSRKLQALAVPLPEGHGRLGDLDKINASLEDKLKIGYNEKVAPYSWSHAYIEMQRILDKAPIIVPAEGGKIE